MYHIIEIKADKWGKTSQIVTPIPNIEDRDKAISQFYYKCVYGADPELSQVDIHTVMLIDHAGSVVDGCVKVFYHGLEETEEQ